MKKPIISRYVKQAQLIKKKANATSEDKSEDMSEKLHPLQQYFVDLRKAEADYIRRQKLAEDAQQATINYSKKNWFERNTFWTAIIFTTIGAIFQWLTGLLPKL